MSTYFTYCLRTGIENKREWYIEELPRSNSLYPIHKHFKQVFEVREDCVNAIYLLIEKEGGRFLDALPVVGFRKGRENKRNLPHTYRERK